MLKHVLVYQVCCFGSVTLILWKMEEKFSDTHLLSKSAAPSQRNSGGAGGVCTESMWREHLIIRVVLCMSVKANAWLLRMCITIKRVQNSPVFRIFLMIVGMC